MSDNPLSQFVIHPYVPIHVGGWDVSFTNESLFMVIVIGLITLLMVLGTRRSRLIPTRLQSMVEIFYEFVENMLEDTCGPKGKPFFPFIFTLFAFILFANLIGLIPYTYTVTSQLVITFSLAIVVFIGATVVGLMRHGLHFLTFFVPKGVPVLMLPMLVPIEILSYFFRPVSLSLRLFANMMAGHTMLKVFAGFVIALGLFVGWLPLGFIAALTGLEVIVAALQAYVFAILACIYLNDGLNMAH